MSGIGHHVGWSFSKQKYHHEGKQFQKDWLLLTSTAGKEIETHQGSQATSKVKKVTNQNQMKTGTVMTIP